MSTFYKVRDDGVEGVARPERRRDTAPFADGRRYLWIVITVVVLTTLGAFISTNNTATTYTGRASLIVSSNNRSPDQDAVLVQGYVDYFNDTAYQGQLLRKARIDTEVTLIARAAAASPIMLIESTARSAADAESSAASVAETFQTDINRVRDVQQKRQLTALRTRLDAVTARGGLDATSSIATLQDQIAQVEADRVNRLQELQFRGGVATNSPNKITNLAFGAFGGLLLGVISALAVARGTRLLKAPRQRRTV